MRTSRATMSANISLTTRNLVTRVAELMGLSNDYKERLSTVQTSLKSAYTRLPDVAEILKSNSERSLFGRLTGDAGLWQKLVLSYQRHEFELPQLRKAASTYDQQLQALRRRHEETLKSAQGALKQYLRECTYANLEGKNVKHELGFAIAQLPLALQAVLTSMHDPAVEAAIDSYCSLCLAHEHDHLAAIHDLLSIENEQQLNVLPKTVLHLLGTDVDVHETGTNSPTAVQFGVVPHKYLNGESTIDVPTIPSLEEADDILTGADNMAGKPASEAVQVEWKIAVAASGMAAPMAQGLGDAIEFDPSQDLRPELPQYEGHPGLHRLAFDAAFRSRFIADLHELQGYLLQRSREQECAPLIPGFLPSESHGLSHATVCNAVILLSDAIHVIQRPEVRVMLRASGSKVFAYRFVQKLRMQLLQSQKFKIRATEILQEQDDVHAKLASVGPLRKERLRYLKATCEQIEAAVSAKTKRIVHIAAAHSWH